MPESAATATNGRRTTVKGRLVNYRTRSFPKREQLLTIEILDTDFAWAYDVMKDDVLDIEIKRHRRRRSKDANAYAWVLMDAIAEALTVVRARPIKAEDVYREAIREIPGVSDIVVVPDGAVRMLRAGWAHKGIGWQSEILGPNLTMGYTNVILYYGSSVFDTKQMGALLDYLIAEAKELAIPTDTQEQIDKYMYYWAQAEAERRDQC